MHLYLYFNEKNLKQCKMFIYVCMYVCMYACVYKFHSETQVPLLLIRQFETSFLYQLFKENSNIIVVKPGKLINEVFF